MSGNLKHCVKLLKENEESIQREARNILSKLCNNILKYPTNARYRRVRLSNPIVASKLLPASGAIECLFEAGFVETDDGFSLPDNSPLSLLEDLRSLLDPSQNKNPPQKSISDCEIPSTSKQSPQKRPQEPPGFFSEIAGHFQDVLRYEDQKLQQRARLLIPLIKLEIGAMERMRCIQRDVKRQNGENECGNRTSAEHDLTIEDLLLAELLRWFKYEFFNWINSPQCNVCSNECSFARVDPSTDPRISRVEVHRCGNCGNEVNFPRYTDPGPLLSTRQGRCGEWANVFTLICRSLGYDARLVVDKTDHVWTEIWSVTNKRWIHADPCENTMDRPLMYEKGWGKKLSYIIAYSKDDIQDVTWRYTKDPKSVKKRRNLCTEENLAVLISKLNAQRQSSISSNRRQYVVKRRVMELIDMLPAPPGSKKPNEEDEDNYEGRSSGSLAWRLARGETQAKPHEPQKWLIPTGVREYDLRYFVVEDIYEARNESSGKELEKRNTWQAGIENTEGGIFRKEETDWKMVYLARSPGKESGFVSWTFEIEISETNLVFDSLKLSATIDTFQEANVRWKVEKFYPKRETKVELIAVEDCRNFETSLKGAVRVNLKAILSGGNGDLAWQHAQLFRQSLNSKKEHSMIIKISLKERQL